MTLIYTTASFFTAPVWARIDRAQHQKVLLLCEFNLYLLAYVEVNLDFSVNGRSWKDFNHRIEN